MKRISFTTTPEVKAKLENHVKNWAKGELKDNISAFLTDLIDRNIPEDPSLNP